MHGVLFGEEVGHLELSASCTFQLARLDSSYPGGLASYIKTARELLSDSKAGKNPFDGFTPSVSEIRLRLFKY